MNILNYKKVRWFLSIVFIYFLIAFKSNNIGIDGYYFLAQWKYHSDLLEPHHLLHHWIYKIFGNLIHWSLMVDSKNYNNQNIDYQGIFQILNSFFFLLALLELHKIRKLITGNSEFFTIMLVGFSGVGLKYATDVEVYIFPLFLSLAGTFKIFQFFQNHKMKDFILGSLFINFAILNHQIQFVWWLIITYFIYKKYCCNFQVIGIYLGFSLMVPLIYGLVAMQNGLGFWEFCLHDYMNGSANLKFSWKSIFLTLINVPRTFLFFNEAFFYLNQDIFVNMITAIIGITFLTSTFLFIQKIRNKFQLSEFQKMIFYLFIAYLLFALISHGNYEFMVCLPFFVVLLLPDLSKIKVHLKTYIFISLFLWNMIFLLIPFRFYDFYGKKDLLKIYQENPNAYFLLNEAFWFRNFIYYHTGKEKPQNILTQFDPKKIKELLMKKEFVLTDYPNKEGLNRRNFMQNSVNLEKNFAFYKKEIYNTFYGERILYEIRIKN